MQHKAWGAALCALLWSGCSVEGEGQDAREVASVTEAFSVTVRVVESADSAVKGAKLTLGGQTYDVDDNGEVELKDLDSLAEHRARVESEQHVGVTRNLFAWHAEASGGLTVRLTPVKNASLPANRGGTLSTPKAEVREHLRAAGTIEARLARRAGK